VWNDGLDLEELLIAVVSPNDGEAETLLALDESSCHEISSQLSWVPCENIPLKAIS